MVDIHAEGELYSRIRLVTSSILVESAMTMSLVLAKSFPGSPQIWKESICVETALVLPDPSIEGE